MTSRRSFFAQLTALTAGVIIPWNLKPKGVMAPGATVGFWMPDQVMEYMTYSWNQVVKGTGFNVPNAIYAGHDLFEAYESRLQVMQRFVPKDSEILPGHSCLAFKSARLYDTLKPGWALRFERV